MTEKAVTRREIIQRINRVLADQNELLAFNSTDNDRAVAGDCMTVNRKGKITRRYLTLEGFAKELGVLNDGETLGD